MNVVVVDTALMSFCQEDDAVYRNLCFEKKKSIRVILVPIKFMLGRKKGENATSVPISQYMS